MKLGRVLICGIIAVILSISCAAAAEMDAFNKKDTVLNSGYVVKDLYTGCSQAFDYEVPEDGVAVLLFFKGNCANSAAALRQFAESRWIDHPQVNIFAVESHGCTQSTVQAQLETAAAGKAGRLHPILGSSSLLFDYVHQVYPSKHSIAYPFVVLISKIGDTPYIRYACEDVQDMETYSAAIEALLAENYYQEDGLLYRLDEYTATVVGYTGAPTDLAIPPRVQGLPVTAIAHSALRDCQSLTYVATFPTTATIEPYAFADCPNLYRADLSCSGSLPEGIFSGCTNLAVCQIDEDIFSVGKGAFDGCAQLQAVLGWNQQQNLAIIKENAFRGCRLLNLSIPSTVQLLEKSAFANSGLTSATLPAGLRSLGTGVFQDCTALKTATVKAGLTALPQATFSGCTALQSVNLPAGLTTIGQETFKNCFDLSSISLPETLTTLERDAFSGSGLLSVTVPNCVTSLGYGVFRDCSNLMSATLPETLTQLPESLFSGCSALTSVALPQGLTELSPTLFELCTALTTVQIPESVTTIGRSAFSYCRSLASVSLPDNLKHIDSNAFSHCRALSSIILPAGVTTMEDHCFSGCDALTAAYFRGNAPSAFGRDVFDDCRYGFTVYYTDGTRGWTDSAAYDSTSSTWNGYPLSLWETTVSGNCGKEDSNVIWTLDMNTGVFTVSGNGAMADLRWEYHYLEGLYAYRPDWHPYRDFIRTVEVADGVTHLGTGSFYQFPALTSVTLADSVASFGDRVFDGCDSLSTACFLGNAPESIGNLLFRGCADDFTILYPDGAAGWTSPTWNDWPAAHSIRKDNTLTHSALVPAGTRAILVTFGESGQMLDCTGVVWTESPLVTLPLPASKGAVSMQLFYLSSTSVPFRSENNLSDLLVQSFNP